jgi:hypothetical protein
MEPIPPGLIAKAKGYYLDIERFVMVAGELAKNEEIAVKFGGVKNTIKIFARLQLREKYPFIDGTFADEIITLFMQSLPMDPVH